MIELKNIHKSYKEGGNTHPVLKDLQLTIKEGEIVVLLGKSGSGKSTLLNIISGIDLPDSGDVIIEGENLSIKTEKERTLFRRKNIGFVF